MADSESVETVDAEGSAERLMAIGEETRRRGRPKGSKNKPREDGEIRVSNSDQRTIFAAAIVALFALLTIAMSWFGYEKVEDLSSTEADEGGKCLLPIAQKVGWIAAAAFYLSFPAWLIVTINKKFRKKPEISIEAPRTEVPGVSPPSAGNSVDLVRQQIDAPSSGGVGFSHDPAIEAAP